MIAVAEPVVVGISEFSAERARRRSFAGRSTMVWVLVTSWIVVIEPCRMPSPSWITFTTGARQLVVQEAAVTRRAARVVDVVVHAIDDIGAPPALTGADTTTFFTPAAK